MGQWYLEEALGGSNGMWRCVVLSLVDMKWELSVIREHISRIALQTPNLNFRFSLAIVFVAVHGLITSFLMTT
jgi:hypothetical protein